MGTETVNASNAYASTPLTPQAGGNEVVVSRLDELLKGFTFQMANCQMDAAPETVHDLRVVIRRLIAFMDVIRGTVPSKSGREIQEALGSLRNRVNDLRNLQVMVPRWRNPRCRVRRWSLSRYICRRRSAGRRQGWKRKWLPSTS